MRPFVILINIIMIVSIMVATQYVPKGRMGWWWVTCFVLGLFVSRIERKIK
jgi:hypothetical protein